MQVRTSEYEITEAMIQMGGGFVSLLGRCIRAADRENKRKLVAAFPEYIKQYDDLAVRRAEQPALKNCASCDGYVIQASEAPYCPTCAREIREKASK